MTEKELFQEILKRMSADKELSAILKKMKAGTADFEDMQRYSIRTAEIRAEVLKENLSPAGNGQNEEACIQILKEQHEDVFQKESAVQKTLDEKQNIHISPKKPKFPAERVRKAAHSLEDKTVSEEVIQRRAENAIANIANSFHDDYIKENAEFRQNAGLKCHVTRTGASKCCAWCAEVAGRFEVGREPADFWRRHDNCSCRMDYENQKVRQRLSGTGKGWKVNSEFQRKQVQRIEYKPTRFTKEQAKAIESEKLSQYRGLTNQAGSGTIKVVPMNRAKTRKREGIKPISDDLFRKLTIEALKNGAIIMRGGEEIESHLDKMGADASTLHDVLFFREEVCISEVIEETYHFKQNMQGMNDDKGEPLRTILNEIDAKQYMLNNARKLRIPRSELELTKQHLIEYQKQLQEYLEGEKNE